MNIDLINHLKYEILKSYGSVKDPKQISELISILEVLENKIINLEKEISTP